MARVWLSVTLAACLAGSGCLQAPGGECEGDACAMADAGDGRADGNGDDGSTALWPELLYVPAADVPEPTGSLDLVTGDAAFDTDNLTWKGPLTVVPPHVVVEQEDASLLVLSLQNLTVGSEASLRFVGSRPVMIVAWGSMGIAGRINVSSYVGDGDEAAGSQGKDCPLPVQPSDGAGGSGGAMQGGGGAGGPGGAAAGPEGPDGLGVPTFPRGGCPGSDASNVDGPLGQGGRAGGAVVLAALDTITITGGIYAGGHGGGGGKMTDVVDYGGGGGGSGGLIVLQANTLIVSDNADLMAKGGGGGGGGGLASQGISGQSGYSPGAARGIWSAGGMGGTDGGGTGGLGGPSSSGGLGGTAGISGDVAGGGGGGGAGFILLHTQSFMPDGTATIAPEPIEL